MTQNWKPTTTFDMLANRAGMLSIIREFMSERGVLEVETPILSHTTVNDPNLQSFVTSYSSPTCNKPVKLYLQTSPEYAMKRLLASGSGPIYQIFRACRNQESGKLHNPEFTLLEWYRPGFDHFRLMDEVNVLLQKLGFCVADFKAYEELFMQYTGINPHIVESVKLKETAIAGGLHDSATDRSALLDFIFSQQISRILGFERPVFVYDYPACQCALAKISQSNPPVAERFELFIQGMEIANGYSELTDSNELKKRYEKEIELRVESGRDNFPIDSRLLDAMIYGLPDSAGVAVGLDRLLMAIGKCSDIDEVIAFPVERS